MKKIARIAITFIVVFAFPLYVFTQESKAATLTSASVSLSDSRPSQATVTYTFNVSGVTATTIKCLKLEFSDTPVGGSKPTGMTLGGSLDVTSSSFLAGLTGWTPDVTGAASGIFKITDVTGASAGNGNVVMTGDITNGSVASTAYFVRFNTYNNTDCSSSAVDTATVAFIYTDGVSVSATVDPTLTFSLGTVTTSQTVNGATTNVATSSATAVDFGSVTTATNKIAAHDLIVTTNATSGYTVYVKYTQLMTSGGNTLDEVGFAGTNASPIAFPAAGTTELLAYTTADPALASGSTRFQTNLWAKYTTSFGTNEVAYNSASVSGETTRVGYQVSVKGTTQPGVYTTTVVYSAVPSY